MSSKTKWYAIGGGVGTLVLLALVIWGLYSLGGSDESALERLTSIAIIFIVLLFGLTIVLLAAIVAALGYLTLQIRDRVIPLLEETMVTLKRMRGTAEFVSEEAVKPIIGVAGTYAKIRTMTKTVTGRNTKPPSSLLK
jgi:hypothetical protein